MFPSAKLYIFFYIKVYYALKKVVNLFYHMGIFASHPLVFCGFIGSKAYYLHLEPQLLEDV